MYSILRFRVLFIFFLVLRGLSYPCGPSNILRVLFYVLVLFIALWIYLSSFLGKKSSNKLWIMLAT